MAIAQLALLFVASVHAHQHHFADHPEWNNIWPETEPIQDLQALSLPVLTGLWTDSNASTARYWLQPSGGGFGTGKDAYLPKLSPETPGTAYDVYCVSGDWQKPGTACTFAKGRCTMTSNIHLYHNQLLAQARAQTAAHLDIPLSELHHHPDHHDHVRNFFQQLGQTLLASPNLDVNVTCQFFDSKDQPEETSVGTVVSDAMLSFNGDVYWQRYQGNLTGIWYGAAQHDYIFLGHNQSDNSLTIMLDAFMNKPVAPWTYGSGRFDPSDMTVAVNFSYSGLLTGTVSSDYTQINGGGFQHWEKWSSQGIPSNIHTVHLVFMNHLDVGYASFINNIDNEYFHKYFPQATQLAQDMRALEGTDRFIYITHTWLLSFFYNCPCSDTNSTTCMALSLNHSYAPPLKCPTPAEMDNLTAAIKRGDISWHGEPFNFEAENMAPELFEAGLAQVRQFDQQFYGENRTLVMSDRDVIYVTRSIIPLLAKYGFQGLTIGSNGADYPPQVPKLHLWRDPLTDTEVVVAYHPYGYGGYSRSTCDGPGQCGDCAEAPNGVALCTAFRTDNSGPPSSTDEVFAALNAVRTEYPRASVFASTFDAFVKDVWPIRDMLPVVEAEVGDTWIYGVPSDPLKMAQNREIQRVWQACLASGRAECAYDNPTIRNMTRFLMKAPEHTWGTPGVGGGWGAGDLYDKPQFYAHLNNLTFLEAAGTWQEQRVYNELAIQALEHDNHPLARTVRARVTELNNVTVENTAGMTAYQPGQSITLQQAQVSLSVADNGGFESLLDEVTQSQWVDPNLPFGLFAYRVLNESDWKPFTYAYINGHSEAGGFCKPGSNNFSESTHFFPQSAQVFSNNQDTVVVQASMPARCVERYGSPATVSFLYTFARDSDNKLSITLVHKLFNKSPTMIGESGKLLFAPAPKRTGPWQMDKLGQPVDPENVVAGGNQCNHAVWDNVSVPTEGGLFVLKPLDTPIMLPMAAGNMSLGQGLPANSNGLLPLAKGTVFGMAANLFNNLWNTNYPTFYPYNDLEYCQDPLHCSNANIKYRFELQLI
eukprot:m.91447 g.91447  ORF g.91447 m.91447 type:complete len:1043 (-) comp14907_c0_seq2:53-3181(-)